MFRQSHPQSKAHAGLRFSISTIMASADDMDLSDTAEELGNFWSKVQPSCDTCRDLDWSLFPKSKDGELSKSLELDGRHIFDNFSTHRCETCKLIWTAISSFLPRSTLSHSTPWWTCITMTKNRPLHVLLLPSCSEDGKTVKHRTECEIFTSGRT